MQFSDWCMFPTCSRLFYVILLEVQFVGADYESPKDRVHGAYMYILTSWYRFGLRFVQNHSEIIYCSPCQRPARSGCQSSLAQGLLSILQTSGQELHPTAAWEDCVIICRFRTLVIPCALLAYAAGSPASLIEPSASLFPAVCR